MANRYWVGGTGVWDASNTTPWSLTSNGAGGQTVPSTGDVALFDSISNPHTITLAYSPAIQSLNFSTFKGIFNANNQTISVSATNGISTNSLMTLLGSPSINVTATSGSSFSYALNNFTYNNINFVDLYGSRSFSGTGYTIDSVTRTGKVSAGTLSFGTGTINNWFINGPGTITGGTITITNRTKLLNGLTFNGITVNTNPVTFYAGKNSTFNSGAIQGVALSDGVFNYNTPKEKIIVLESGTSWTVPNDFTSVNTIHLFGGGGGGGFNPFSGFGTGGGGGGYTQVSNLNLTPGSTITYSIGLGGAANTNGGNTSFSTYTANGGSSGLVVPSNTTAAGGAGGIGLTYNGGSGGSVTASPSVGGTGGGGAGGPYGNGTSGATRISSGTGQGGGSNGGGTSATGIYGGVSLWPKAVSGFSSYGNGGLGGNAGGNPSFFIGSGGDGSNGIDVNSVAGGGGGGGSADSDGASLYGTISGNGGLYGGGGAGSYGTVPAGLGANGAVIIVYNTSPSPLKHRLDNTGTLKTGTYFNESPITFVGSSKTISNVFNGSVVVNVPTGTSDDDLMVAFVSVGGGTFNTLSGWTLAYNGDRIGIFYRTAKSEPASYTFTTNPASYKVTGYILTYRNAKWDTVGTASLTTVAPAITVAKDNSILIDFIGGSPASTNFSTPTGFNFIDSDNDADGTSSALFSSTSNAGTSVSPSSTVSGTGTNGYALLSALSPAAKSKFTANNIVGQFDERTEKVVFITSGTTFTIPSDFKSLVSVECIGAGGGQSGAGTAGNGGAGGGAYSKSTVVTGLVAGNTAYVSVGVGGNNTGTSGGDTWFNASANAAPTLTSQGALAKGGGGIALGGSNFGSGGTSANCIGTISYSGGNGGLGASLGSAGSGGAAGPGGVGGKGGDGFIARAAGGGGGAGLTGAGGSAPTFGTTGGTGGAGKGVPGGSNTTAGLSGIIYISTNNSTAGPGSGAGGGQGVGGSYGGGGTTGGNGLIVFTYKSSPMSISNTGIISVSGVFDEYTGIE